MGEFLKDYFLCFFANKRAKNIYKRSFIITFINVIILLLSLFLSSFLSQEISFKYYYNHSRDFKNIIQEVIPDDTALKNGVLSIDSIYNGFNNDSSNFIEKGYYVVVDTRDPKTTFDDFTFSMINEKDESISYSDYLFLTDEEKENYSALINRSGVCLDTIANISLYESYLSSLENHNDFDTVRNQFENGEISQLEYANKIYVLYAKQYYPEDVYTCDSYGGLPTLRTYYLAKINSLEVNQQYIFLFKEGIESCFSSKGNTISFYGEFKQIGDLNFSNNKIQQIDNLVLKSFNESSSLRSVSFLFVSFFTWFLFILVFVIAVFVTRLILSIVHKNERHYTIKIMNLMGSFLLFASLFSFVLFMLLSFVLSRNAIIVALPICVFFIVIIRTFIYYSIEKHASDVITEE